jgi:hypothetical protein
MIKVNNAVKELAKAEGYSYIFERTTLLHAGGDDISDKVRKKLGISLPTNLKGLFIRAFFIYEWSNWHI